MKKLSNKKLNSKVDIDQLLLNTGDMALKRRARAIVVELDPQNGERILDVGCGDGYYLYLLSSLGLRLKLYGVDFDKQALATASYNLAGKKITLKTASLMDRLPFEDNYFDKIVMSEVAEHLPDDKKGLKEVFRVLKKGGVLALTVPHHNYPLFWDPLNWVLERTFNTHVKSGFWAGIWNQHIRLYYREEIVKVLKKSGFEIVKSEVQTKWCLPFNHQVINLGARMLKSKVLPEDLSTQINKFKKYNQKKRSNLVKLYYGISNFADHFNNNINTIVETVGMTVFVLAKKPKH